MARKGMEYPSSAAMYDYLASRGIAYSPRSSDPAQQQAYLQRLYRGAIKQEGQEFSRAKARGHTPRIQRIPAGGIKKEEKRKKQIPEQYRVTGTEKKPLDQADIKGLLNKANPKDRTTGQRREDRTVRGSITGLIKYQNPVTGDFELVEKTYSFRIDVESLEAMIAEFGDDIVGLATAISGYPWEEVFSINLLDYSEEDEEQEEE